MENVQKSIKFEKNTKKLNYKICYLKIDFEKNYEKSHVSINKPGYLRFLLLDSSNSQIHEFWYDYLQ